MNTQTNTPIAKITLTGKVNTETASTYSTQANAKRAAKRIATKTNVAHENLIVQPVNHLNPDTRFKIIDVTVMRENAKQHTAKPIPQVWAYFDKHGQSTSYKNMKKHLIEKGFNSNMVKSQAYRHKRWSQGTWVRPISAPVQN